MENVFFNIVICLQLKVVLNKQQDFRVKSRSLTTLSTLNLFVNFTLVRIFKSKNLGNGLRLEWKIKSYIRLIILTYSGIWVHEDPNLQFNSCLLFMTVYQTTVPFLVVVHQINNLIKVCTSFWFYQVLV